ncbi:hypothetical protein ABHN05_13055 [Brevibacillus laterosporus]|uniref:hypothetical protein n=1 Tax=Brevibacillus laterosporus TaxID=1465 RepID=UPI00138682DB|nr:hypothetical protein [Brevibacillus laterosporus]MED1790527.1 hypothetical protein [Brevibacillus laterosporus]MED4762112.1 hypothetical protein [Brevibacillus laterosporus]
MSKRKYLERMATRGGYYTFIAILMMNAEDRDNKNQLKNYTQKELRSIGLFL